MSIKTGTQTIEFPAFSKIRIIAEKDFTVFRLTADEKSGELLPDKIFCTSLDKQVIVRTKESAVPVQIKVPASTHWSVDIDQDKVFDKADPIPFEVPEELKKPETLEEKLRRFAAGMIAERYGENSDEYETFEESMDFEIDDEIPDAVSQYEVQEMVDEFPAEGSSEAETNPAPSEPDNPSGEPVTQE